MSNKKISWSASCSVGNKLLDEQHRHLCDVANKIIDLGEEMPIINAKEKLLFLLTQLGDNALYHFETEEEMLKKKNAPGTAEHLEKHKLYKEEIAKFISSVRDSRSDGIELHKQVLDFVTEWVGKHMLGISSETQLFEENEQKE